MKSKFFRLVVNEQIKQFGKKSTLVLAIALLVITVGVCVIAKFTNGLSQRDYNLNSYQYMLSDTQAYIDSVSGDPSKSVELGLATLHKDYYNGMVQKQYYSSQWKQALYASYFQAKANAMAADFLTMGVDESKLIGLGKNSAANYPVQFTFDDSQEFWDQAEKVIDRHDFLTIKNDWLKKAADLMKSMDGPDGYRQYLDGRLKASQNTLSAAKGKVLDTEKQLAAASKENQPALQALLDQDRGQQAIAEADLWVIQTIINKNIDVDDKNDPRNFSLNNYQSNISQYYSFVLLSKEDFLQQSAQSGSSFARLYNGDYDQYQKAMERQRTQLRNAAAAAKYETENKIANPGAALGFRSCLSMFSSMIMVLALISVIIAGTSVSSEFSSGSIRLLMMRPVKRWKILLSKYLSFLLTTLCLLVLILLSAALAGLALYGVSDAFVPYVAVNAAGQPYEIPYLFHLLGTSALSLVNPLLMGTLAFMLSTLTHNSALSVGVGMFLSTLGTLIATVLMYEGWWWLKILLPIDLVYLGSPSSYSFTGLTVPFALLTCLAYYLVFLLLSFIPFQKRDIK